MVARSATALSGSRGSGGGGGEGVSERSGERGSAGGVVDKQSLLLPGRSSELLGGYAGTLTDGGRRGRHVIRVVTDGECIPGREGNGGAGADAARVGSRGGHRCLRLRARELRTSGRRLPVVGARNRDSLRRRGSGRDSSVLAAASKLASRTSELRRGSEG